MSYNRWISSSYDLELYHHGVKGMKWGKHLFGKGVEMPQGAGGGGGGLLEEEPSDEELKEAEKEYWDLYDQVRSLTPEQMVANREKTDQLYKNYYAALEKLQTERADYNKKKEAYEQSASYKIKHPVETAKKALDKADTAVTNTVIDVKYGVREKLGVGARENYKRAKLERRKFDHYNYDVRDDFTNRERKESNERIRKYREEYANTPLGKASAAIDKGKKKVESLFGKRKEERRMEAKQEHARDRATRRRDFYRDMKEYAEMERQESARKKYADTHKQPVNPGLPHGRKRKISQNGTGVNLTTPIGKRKRWP